MIDDAPSTASESTILVIDNYDSFVYNLAQYAAEHAAVVVRRNDAIDPTGIGAMRPDGIIVSPGPGHPDDAGVTASVFALDRDVPTLGVCLGHQALCATHGAPVEPAPAVVHGKPSTIRHDGRGVFADLPTRFSVGRYHSLAVDRSTIPEQLVETAWTEVAPEITAGSGHDPSAVRGDTVDPADGDGDRVESLLMGVRHRDRPHIGVQFHPESVLTGDPDAGDLSIGRRLVRNFCRICAGGDRP